MVVVWFVVDDDCGGGALRGEMGGCDLFVDLFMMKEA